MVDKSKLSKDIEEQIQSLASDVYIQVEEKLTNLITAAVTTELNKNTDQQNKALSEKEKSLQKGFSEKEHLQAQELAKLKDALVEQQADEEMAKQHFQVELTQNTINYTETIELLEKELANVKQQSTLNNNEKQSSNNKLDEKLLETEQKLNDRAQEVDGLNGRIMVLTEQEQSLSKQLVAAKEQVELNLKQKNEAVLVSKTEAEASAKQQIDILTEKLQLTEKQQSDAVTAVKIQAEASAKQQVDALTEKLQRNEKKQNETVTAVKNQAESTTKQQIDALTEKLQKLERESARVLAETLKNNNIKIQELEHKSSQLAEQIEQEENGKAELQQQLSEQQKSIDEEQDKAKKAEQKNQDYQTKIAELTEQADINNQQSIDETKLTSDQAEQVKQLHLDEIEKINEDAEQVKQLHFDEIEKINEDAEQVKQRHLDEMKKINDKTEILKQLHLDEIKTINEANEQVKQLQITAQQNIIELEKANKQLSDKVDTEQNDIKLYQQEVSVLNDQVKVAQEGQENILQRFNSNRDRQEVENNKVRETIKFLRDENHQLISDSVDQKAEFTDKLSEVEHKLTEYRLKFEYAQKQLMS
jgi:hypothetical protein